MKLADYSAQASAAQLDFALRAGGFDGVFHYLAGTPGFVLRVEDPAVVADVRVRGWPQAGIDVPRMPSDVDASATADRVYGTYGFVAGFEIYLDIEPSQYRLDPAGWAVAADRWCDTIRTRALIPGVYGTDETVAACANHASRIWRAVPGECDPAGPGLAPGFFAGLRAIQCGNGTWGGIEFDVSYSQFVFVGGIQMTGSFPAHDEAEAFVDAVLYGALAGEEPPTPDDREHWVQIALSQGLWSAADQFLNDPNVTARRELLKRLVADYQAGNLSKTGPAGPPGPAYDDSGLQAAVAALKADIQAIKSIP